MEYEIKDHLCKCLNCGSILIDKNPQVGAHELPISGDELDMIAVSDGEYIYWVCPICKVDDYLIDL